MVLTLNEFRNLTKLIYTNYYSDLGKINLLEDSNLEIIKINVIPHEGFHKNINYIITLIFQEINNWPLVYIDSELYDKIKTNQYLEGRGRNGQHKGICIKNLSYSYNFNRNFKDICGNKWENYIFNLICVFNNIEDFTKGNGIKSTYKDILNI
jgi:hypothetical protein